jgi:hypothetical protein
VTDTPTAIEGRPITGDVSKGRRTHVDQWDAPTFLEMLDAVFAVPTVTAVKWSQYTPYFNDGDTCEFGVNDFEVAVTDPPAGAEPESEDYNYDDDTTQVFFSEYAFKDYDNPENNHPVYAPLDALDSASGHFEAMLYDHFGDHAYITATRDGFRVETYEHD